MLPFRYPKKNFQPDQADSPLQHFATYHLPAHSSLRSGTASSFTFRAMIILIFPLF